MSPSAARARAVRPRRALGIAIGCGLVSALLVGLACWPGYLNNDSTQQLTQAVTGRIDDWHAPFTVLLWSAWLRLLPGAAGPFVMDGVLIWGGCLVLLLRWRERLGMAGWLIPVLPVLPGLCNYIGQVQVDTIMLALLLAGSACAALALAAAGRSRATLRGGAVLLVMAAVLVRPNAIFCIVPLLGYALAGLAPRRRWLLGAAVLLSLPLLLRAADRVADATPTGVASAIPLDGLLALSRVEHQTLVPGDWSPEQARRIRDVCYTPIYWDSAWYGPCAFVFDGLHRQGLWGGTALWRRWIAAGLRHPGGAFVMQMLGFRQLLFAPNSPDSVIPAANRWNDRVARPAPGLFGIWRRYVESPLVRWASLPAAGLVLAALGTLVAIRRPAAASEPAALGLALLLSAQIYLLGFAAYGIASEYRYAAWPQFATALGLLLLLAPRPGGAGAGGAAAGPAFRPPGCRILAAATLALVAAAASVRLPAHDRVAVIRPDSARPVRVEAVTDASVPDWVAAPAMQVVENHGWIVDRDGTWLGIGAGPLAIRARFPDADLRVRLGTGPGMGRATVSSAGDVAVRDTAAPVRGHIDIVLPSVATGAVIGRARELETVLVALAVFAAALGLSRTQRGARSG